MEFAWLRPTHFLHTSRTSPLFRPLSCGDPLRSLIVQSLRCRMTATAATLPICASQERRDPGQLYVHPKISEELRNGRPVVALESTIIAHGLPYPDNLQTAQKLEETVRSHNVTPATIAVLDGVPLVGLTPGQLRRIASANKEVCKLARRDLPRAYALRLTGATTVSATMEISAAAGISVFATGGIGGVHRQVSASWDISADITALGQISQLVVCAGAKSILDVPKTLEALETASVPVLVLGGETATFPAFYTRGTLPAPAVIDSTEAAARVFHLSRESRTAKGVLLAVPVPKEFEADAAVIEPATRQAISEMEQQEPPLRPNEITPFLLKRIAEITDGASLRANVHLARNNAAVAAHVAKHLCALSNVSSGGTATPLVTAKNVLPQDVPLKPEVLVVGATGLDIHCDADRRLNLHMNASNTGLIRQCLGGVGRNVADAASRLGGARVALVSAVGDDFVGENVLQRLRESTMDVSGVRTYAGRRTSTYCVVHDRNGDIVIGVGDMDNIFSSQSRSLAEESRSVIESALKYAKVCCVDGNLSPSDIRLVSELCVESSVPCWFEPTTPQKSTRVVEKGALQYMSYLSPNLQELSTIAEALSGSNQVLAIEQQAWQVLERGGGGARGQSLIVTCGNKGIRRFQLRTYPNGGMSLLETWFRAEKVEVTGNTTGAGDTFAGRCIAALAHGIEEEDAIRLGMEAAEKSCQASSHPRSHEGMSKL